MSISSVRFFAMATPILFNFVVSDRTDWEIIVCVWVGFLNDIRSNKYRSFRVKSWWMITHFGLNLN